MPLLAAGGLVALLHYATGSLLAAHYSSVALFTVLVLLLVIRVPTWQGVGLSVLATLALLSDEVWLREAGHGLVVELLPVLAFALVVSVASARRELTLRPEPAVPTGYYWDFAATTAMGSYITEVEAGFIRDSLAQFSRTLRLAVDLGAGSGRFTRELAAVAEHVVATEVDEALISSLAEISPRVSPILVSERARRIPVLDASADCIICLEVPDLTHQPWFYRECRRALKPGGLLIITLQNRRSWKGLPARRQEHRYRTKFGATYYAYSLDELVDYLHDAGFELEDSLGFNWLPFRRTSDSPLVGPFAKVESLLQLRQLATLSPWVILRARLSAAEPSD